jgi:hypothetical protein
VIDVTKSLTKVNYQFAQAMTSSDRSTLQEKRELLQNMEYAITELQAMRSQLIAAMDTAQDTG